MKEYRDVKIYDDEAVDDLQLNGLKLIQKNKNFRFGIDAVILSDYANIKYKHKVIDLCTGTGVIPMLLYGKYRPQKIVGLEIQSEMVDMGNRTASINKVQDKIEIVQGDLKDIEFIKTLGKYDVLTVNPPYKLNNRGITNINDKVAIARHEIMCTLEDVIVASRQLLADNGRMYMVHRPEKIGRASCRERV